MDASRYDPSIILILFNTSKESYLLLLAFLSCGAVSGGVSSYNVIPIVAKHCVSLATACLPIG